MYLEGIKAFLRDMKNNYSRKIVSNYSKLILYISNYSKLILYI